MNRIHKLAACFMIGTLAFTGKAVVAHADEVAIAGIDLTLDDLYQNNDQIDITTYLPSEFDDIAFADASSYVNIRSKANENSEILGKLYNNSAATILEKKGDWYKVKSGNVTGYMKSDYLITGKKAKDLAKTLGSKLATVTTTTLKVRSEASTDAEIVTLIPKGDQYKVIKNSDGWVKISLGGSESGYVSSDFVKVSTEFEDAVSIEEEQQNLQDEASAAQTQEHSSTASTSHSSSSSSSSETTQSTSSQSSSGSSIRSKIVQYALKFNGNPYVWGGTSLTNGADCSGFTQSVFRDYGISIPRTSRSQAASGRRVSLDNLQPGDLIFYDRGGYINHVALYIGNGKVISASSPETGIRITPYNYRTPYKAVSYIN